LPPTRVTVVFAALTLLPLTVGSAEPTRSGVQIVRAHCSACHDAGWNEAPVTGIKTDWQPRLAKGFDAMLANTKQGMGAMPAMGTCAECTDAELKAAIEEMTRF
jgi:cytochrome c5